MTTRSLADLTKVMTFDEAKATIYTALAARGVEVTLWIAGAPTRALIAALSIMLAAFSTLVVLLAKSGFLALSERDWLTLVAKYVYGVDRLSATQASGLLTLTNAGVGVYNKGIGELVVARGTKTYRNTASFSLGALASITVPIAADELGSGSTSTGGTITTMATPLPGVSCTNASSLVGLDEESDEQLRSRCAAKLGTLSPFGPRDAYDFLSKSAVRADGSSIGVTRTKPVPDGIGGIDFYLADAGGGLTNPTDVATIDAILQRYAAPLGITLRTHAAGTLTIAYTYELWVPSTVTDDDATVEAKVAAAVTAFLGTKAIGGDVISPATGKLYKSALEDVIGSVYPKVRRSVTLPAADVDVGSTAAPTAGIATPTAIHRVAA